MLNVVESPPEADLVPLVAWLRFRNVPHRVWEEGGTVRLRVPDDEHAESLLAEGLALLRSGELIEATGTRVSREKRSASAVAEARRTPATAIYVVLALLFFPFTAIETRAVGDFTLRWLMIVPIERIDAYLSFPSLEATLRAGEIWRLWTPAFLHFGVLHLLFNLLWLWEFGRRVELGAGAGRLLEALIFIAPVANVVQYAVGDGPRFGGLSGCVFGLLAYLVVAHRLTGRSAFALPVGVVLFLILSLVAFSTGAASAFGLHVANGAHWGGFLAGMVLATIRFRSTAGGEPSLPR